MVFLEGYPAMKFQGCFFQSFIFVASETPPKTYCIFSQFLCCLNIKTRSEPGCLERNNQPSAKWWFFMVMNPKKAKNNPKNKSKQVF